MYVYQLLLHNLQLPSIADVFYFTYMKSTNPSKICDDVLNAPYSAKTNHLVKERNYSYMIGTWICV